MVIRIRNRELTPFERLVAEHLCDGLSNSAIAEKTSHTEKVIENTVSRMASAFNIKSNKDINLRVLLALAYRAHFGDGPFDKLEMPCAHFEVGADGKHYCTHHI